MWYLGIIFAIYLAYLAYHEWAWWSAPPAFIGVLATTYPLQWLWVRLRHTMFPHLARKDARQALGMHPPHENSVEQLWKMATEGLLNGESPQQVRDSLLHGVDQELADKLLERANSLREMSEKPDFIVTNDISGDVFRLLLGATPAESLFAFFSERKIDQATASGFVKALLDAPNHPDPTYPGNLRITSANDKQRAALSALQDAVLEGLREGQTREYLALRVVYYCGASPDDARRFIGDMEDKLVHG